MSTIFEDIYGLDYIAVVERVLPDRTFWEKDGDYE